MKLSVGYLFLLISFVSIAEDETVTEKALLKADILQNRLNTMMQDTASWLDGIGNTLLADDATEKVANSDVIKSKDIKPKNKDIAAAKGYLQLSWLPQTANLDKVDANFKVALHLPQWNNRLALVIDNDNEDEMLLDYESNYQNDKQEGVNVAFQYIKQFNDKRQIKNRIGISRKQLYLRSEILFNWQLKEVDLILEPRLDYYLQDGWGPGVKGVANYPLEKSRISLSATWQKIQSETKSRQKIGLFHIKSTGDNKVLVSGIQYVKSNDKYDVSNESYYLSIRHRNLVYKSWMYFEIEPFIEFNQVNNFKTEVGVALSVISYYGE